MKNNYFEISDFIDVKKINKKIKKQKEDFWLEGLNGKALTTFKYALETKAYPKFLKENNLDPAEIRTITDFKRIPIMTKSNYLYLYPFEDILVTPVEKIKSFFMSSGSTGEPGIWPRLPQSDKSYSIFVNFLYELYWKISTKKTLYISALDLGIWASGNLQFHAALYCSENHNFTFANTGADFKYIYEVIRKLYKYYDQIIIAAYPSFARRLLDFLSNTDLDITKIDFKFMLGGESHTIEWRYYLLRKLGRAEDDISRIIDYYGTSDSGGPGLSTPLTAMIQNLCFKDTSLCMKLFNQSTVPSLFQQNPFLYVESVNNKIIVTYSGQLPLCRYDSGDNGNILKFTQVVQILKESGYKLDALTVTAGTSFTQELENSIDPTLGQIRYDAGVLGSTVNTRSTLATIKFKAITAGVAAVNIVFDPNSTTNTSIVAAASGPTNLLTDGNVNNGSYTISATGSGTTRNTGTLPGTGAVEDTLMVLGGGSLLLVLGGFLARKTLLGV
jgi:phenylacetate-CoA ligase